MHRSFRLLRPSTVPLRQITPISRSIHTASALPAKSLPFPQKQLSLAYLGRNYATANPDPQFARSPAVQEIKGVTRDLAEMISGRTHRAAEKINKESDEGAGPQSHGSVTEDFYTITSTLARDVPKPALLFGLAGVLPYLGTAFGTVFLAREASIASRGLETISGLDLETALSALHTIEAVQIGYGATILSFLGAIHWGFEFSQYGGVQGYSRLLIGTIPVLIAWPTTFLTHGVALAVQWFGFTGAWFLDQQASRDGWTPSWYSTYRFYLSIIVGFSIIGTFAGTGYYGAGAGAINSAREPHLSHTTERVSASKRLDRLGKAKAAPANAPDRSGRISGLLKGEGDLELVDNEEGDSYTILRKRGGEEEEEEEDEEDAAAKEEEEQENKEFQDKRDEAQMDKAPGRMKDSAKDRTGVNANVPGGVDEKEDMKAAGGNRETENNNVRGPEGGDTQVPENREK